MARATPELVNALERTIDRLAGGTTYWWGHMGLCNCGHLAQSITGLTEREIHASAMDRMGDWEEQANDYCPTSGLLIDTVLAAMFDLGLTGDDIRHLEKLSDPEILRRLPEDRWHLRRNVREDVLLYMKTWRAMLASSLHLQRAPELRRLAVADEIEAVTDERQRGAVDPAVA